MNALDRIFEALEGRASPMLIEAAKEELAQLRKFDDSFKAAVIDALIVSCIYQNEHETNPRKALNELLAWHQQVALDPAVSSDARALIERGRREPPAKEPKDDFPDDYEV